MGCVVSYHIRSIFTKQSRLMSLFLSIAVSVCQCVFATDIFYVDALHFDVLSIVNRLISSNIYKKNDFQIGIFEYLHSYLCSGILSTLFISNSISIFNKIDLIY